MSINDQGLIRVPFAQNASSDYRFEITDENQTDYSNKATFLYGFPPVTMQREEAGGTPPFGEDFNGILHHLSKAIQYLQSGEFTQYNSQFSQAIGGYRTGAIVKGSDGILYRCNQDSNTSDPIDLNGWEVLFNSATDSDSETTAATPKSVKDVADIAKNTANDALSKSNGGTVTGDTNFTGALQQNGNDVITATSIKSLFENKLTDSGYQKLPNGLIIQWQNNFAPTTGNISLPISFPNKGLALVVGNTDRQGAGVDNAYGYIVDNSTIFIALKGQNNTTNQVFKVSYIAIGY